MTDSMPAADPELMQLGHPQWALAFKRLLDVLVAVLALLLLWPVMLVIAVLVKLTSPGPILYRGVRAGLYGKPFHILKFRTMVANAERVGGPTTGKNDARVTWIGRKLRLLKLDELPQFINVLIGQMSLIGPRPEVLEVTDGYQGDDRLILQMRPGISDLASIEFIALNELVGDEDPYAYFREHILPKKNALRLKYVRQWSLALDCRIAWWTFWAIIRKACGKR